MKKTIMIIGALIVAAILTLGIFELINWYHIGDVITKQIAFRLIVFFCALSGIAISIVAIILKKQK